MVLLAADDLLVLAVGFLLTSLPLYGLVGMQRTGRSAEAAVKTYLLGALLGIVMLLGITVLYGVGGATAYGALARGLVAAPSGPVLAGAVALLAGLLFEAGAVPGHVWVPDAAQGASVTAAAFLTTVPKVGAALALYRFVLVLPLDADIRLLVGILAVASMTVGNLAALAQDDVRRLLGWSTISQVGYLLVPVAVAGRSGVALPSLLVYLAAYAVANLTAFAVVAAVPDRRTVADSRGLVRAHPGLTGALVLALLGLLGTPPLSVFVGKLTVASAAVDGGSAWLAGALVASTVLRTCQEISAGL